MSQSLEEQVTTTTQDLAKVTADVTALTITVNNLRQQATGLVAPKDIAATARHYGTLRFSQYALFNALMGGLIFLVLGKDTSVALQRIKPPGLVGYLGIALSIAFFLMEVRMSQLIVFYQEEAEKALQWPQPRSHSCWRTFVPILLLAPYVLSVVFWTSYICSTN